MPWRVQLAFQGGGARFIQHLAVASAFQKLEGDGLIEISRVAGTSAGSLAAAIVAAGVSAESAAKTLQRKRAEYVQKLGMPSALGKVGRFCFGDSLVSSKNLEAVFQDFWDHVTTPTGQPRRGSKKPILMTELQKPILVMSTNMADRTPKVFGDNSEHELIASLVRSCAIPVVYRSVRHLPDEPFVDGGLVENLPLDRLIEGEEGFGDVIGISFSEPASHHAPGNQIQYLYALYNVASTYNVEHMKKKINRNLIFNIQTDIEPLDFETAFAGYGPDGAEFGRLREEALSWIRDRERAHGPAPAGAHQIWVDEEPPGNKMMELTGEVYNSLFASIPYRIQRRDIIVKAHSLLERYRPGDVRRHHPDEVHQDYYIAPQDRRIYCVPLRLDWTGQETGNSVRILDVLDRKSRRTVSPILVPCKGIPPDAESGRESQALVYFDPPLEPDAGDSYPVRVRDFAYLYGVMADFLEDGASFIGVRNHSAWPVEEARLILAVPNECHYIQEVWRTTEDPEVYVAGESIQDEELDRDYDFLGADFRLMGWRIRDLKPGKRLSARLFLTDMMFQDR